MQKGLCGKPLGNWASILAGSPSGGKAAKVSASLQLPGSSEEQKQIKRLQKELKEAQLERDIVDPMLTHVAGPKKAVSIFFKGEGKYVGL
jgi:hypothetical protein